MPVQYGLLGWVVVGLLAGGLARLIMPGREPKGLWATLALGVLGAVTGGFLSAFVPGLAGAGGNLFNIVVATGGAVLLLWLWRIMRGRPL